MVAFTFFAAGPPAPTAIGGHLDAGTFLLGSARTLPGACAAGTCTVAALVCSVGRGGTKRARATVAGLPASLWFAALGGGATEDAAAEEPTGME
jgi:hypothetical protein